MKYRNKKTGIVIKTTGKVSGGNWELIKEETVNLPSDTNVPEDGPIDEGSAVKAKATRRGKK